MGLYVPPQFRQRDPAALERFVREHGFGTLVTAADGELQVSHLPFVLETASDGRWTLYSHVARANPHSKRASGSALVTFLGPHHYVSPTWYEEEETVPTWNYVAVHARGALEWLRGPGDDRRVLAAMVAAFEAGSPRPWTPDFDSAYIKTEMAQIAPFRIDVASVEGKWKLNQHHPLERRVRTARALARLPSQDAHAIAALMDQSIRAEPGAAPPGDRAGAR